MKKGFLSLVLVVTLLMGSSISVLAAADSIDPKGCPHPQVVTVDGGEKKVIYTHTAQALVSGSSNPVPIICEVTEVRHYYSHVCGSCHETLKEWYVVVSVTHSNKHL